MRNDMIGGRTRLLATLACLGAATWAATLLGTGSRAGTPSALQEIQPLPTVPTLETTRLQAIENTEALARPLFATDRQPHPFVIGESGQPRSSTIRLTGVLITPDLSMAMVTTDQGQSLRLRVGGDPQEGWQLLSLQPRAAVLSGPSGTLELELQVSANGHTAPIEGRGPPSPVDMMDMAPRAPRLAQPQAPPRHPQAVHAPPPAHRARIQQDQGDIPSRQDP